MRVDGNGNPITTTNAYDWSGSLTNVAYSDATSAVTNTYDRLGRPNSITQNGATDTMTYNLAGELLKEFYAGGILDGFSVTNGYDQYLRRTNLSALTASSRLLTTTYGYDHVSRLSTVTDGNNNSATYSYVANSPLVSQITFKQSSTTRMTTTKQYDYLNRLTSIASQPGAAGVPPVSFNYSYNAANQRTQDKLADGGYWVYGYDSLGQVTSGRKYFYDGTPVPGQQFGYSFDDIGNRKQTLAGGDQTGGNQRLANYSANNLNQITSRDYPGTNDVVGAALATNTVTVNGQTAWRKGEYFWSTAKTNNASSAQWLGVTVASGGTSNTGSLYLPQTPEQFGYDADGNLTNDGRWSYVWDAENRLIQMTVNTNVGPQYQLTFAYDAQSRRIQKIVATNGVAYSTNNFLYDGWNLIATLSPNSQLQSAYMWGNDLSGLMQGAGGVGGLLEMSYHGTTTTNCFPAFDGNGNLAALLNAADGTLSANYEYGPFGETIRMTGTVAKNNPFRFSTKYQDDESDLFYYGYRYYKPSSGMWVSKDPSAEFSENFIIAANKSNLQNMNNLYRFVNEDSINLKDFVGLWPSSHHIFINLMFNLDTPTTHQNSIRRAIPNLNEHDYEILEAASVEVDKGQDISGSYQHAMRSPNQSLSEAKEKANWFVEFHLIMAKMMLCGCSPDRDAALREFGLALHTIQDATSPAHTGFQIWYGESYPLLAFAHVKKEDYDPGSGSHLDKATTWFWSFIDCKKAIPPIGFDFFLNLGSDPANTTLPYTQPPY